MKEFLKLVNIWQSVSSAVVEWDDMSYCGLLDTSREVIHISSKIVVLGHLHFSVIYPTIRPHGQIIYLMLDDSLLSEGVFFRLEAFWHNTYVRLTGLWVKCGTAECGMRKVKWGMKMQNDGNWSTGQTTRPQLLRSWPHATRGRCSSKLCNADVESSILCMLS